MTRLEVLGMVEIARRTIAVLVAHGYDGNVWNGDRCMSCQAYGFGTSGRHEPTCRGVALLAELRAFVDTHGGAG